MKQFRFIGKGIAKGCAKTWLDDKYKALPYMFSLSHAKPGLFSVSVMKRLNSAKKHGTIITLRKGRGYLVGIELVDRAQALEGKKKAAYLKRRYRRLLSWLVKDHSVVKFCEAISFLRNDIVGMSYSSYNSFVLHELNELVEKYLEAK